MTQLSLEELLELENKHQPAAAGSHKSSVNVETGIGVMVITDASLRDVLDLLKNRDQPAPSVIVAPTNRTLTAGLNVHGTTGRKITKPNKRPATIKPATIKPATIKPVKKATVKKPAQAEKDKGGRPLRMVPAVGGQLTPAAHDHWKLHRSLKEFQERIFEYITNINAFNTLADHPEELRYWLDQAQMQIDRVGSNQCHGRTRIIFTIKTN
jgi:hypothetical protein